MEMCLQVTDVQDHVERRVRVHPFTICPLVQCMCHEKRKAVEKRLSRMCAWNNKKKRTKRKEKKKAQKKKRKEKKKNGGNSKAKGWCTSPSFWDFWDFSRACVACVRGDTHVLALC